MQFCLLVATLILSDPYAQAILVNGCACILELLAEPLYILPQNLLLLKLRLLVETVATLLRCLTMYILIRKQTSMVYKLFCYYPGLGKKFIQSIRSLIDSLNM